MAQFLIGTVGAPLSTPKKPGGSVGGVHHLRSLGLGAFELGWVQSVRVSEATCHDIHQASDACGVALSVHAPYYINLNADDTEWPKSRQRLMDAAVYGNMAGATDIVFHPGSYFGKPPEEVLPIAIERLKDAVGELRALSNPVTLRPETMGKTAMLGSLEDTLIMSREVPGVEPCLDFAHLHARAGNGTFNTKEEWLQVLDDYAKALGEAPLQRLHIHLSGIAYSEKGEKSHLPITESDFNLVGLLEALHERNCGGRILCESPVMEEDALLIQKEWERICS